ncbi:MAG: PLD nuclease N-terminal domain-containing protein [Bifidobacteriaceae bacterium]|nr:PLD nuclease N-terminal domain-containing protein [Bifidobacteriaceae bacterium]
MARVLLLYVLPLVLMIYAIVDCAVDDNIERTSVPKALWIVIIILFPYFGPLAWLAVSKIAKPRLRAAAGGPPGALPRRTPRRPGPVAPDDNPDFLRHLAEEQARRERERRRREKQDGAGDEPPGGDKG